MELDYCVGPSMQGRVIEMPCLKDKPVSDSRPGVPTLSSIPVEVEVTSKPSVEPPRDLKPILSFLFRPVTHLVLLKVLMRRKNILRLKLKLLGIISLREIESVGRFSSLGVIPSPFLLCLLSLPLDCWFSRLVFYLSSPQLLSRFSSVHRLPGTLSLPSTSLDRHVV
ncbi:hypothetical protein M9H77_14070 [Catharanthus roseus]|uniref:Uncharacterized protein n=1 Tax=Catharanthus roseus TaxID=4058 RepID=A0ACC0BM86_CATRO|nr:hypothetical protein M9H77_14070 [Catharanthus roseus]